MKTGRFLNEYEEILHELPIAKDWSEIEDVVYKNDVIRKEINFEIGEEWKKWAGRDRKEYLKKHIFMNPDACTRVLEGYKNINLDNCDFSEDEKYFILKLWQRVKDEFDLVTSYKRGQEIQSVDAAVEIVEIFKDWVENNRGWAEILGPENKPKEKNVQRLIHLAAKYYLVVNNFDMSCEPNEGPGPVDFKISRGNNDKTVIELKLSSNPDYMHGYEEQVEKYAMAERTEQMIYILVDVGHPIKVKKLLNKHEQDIADEKGVPDVIIIDSKEQKSASKR